MGKMVRMENLVFFILTILPILLFFPDFSTFLGLGSVEVLTGENLQDTIDLLNHACL